MEGDEAAMIWERPALALASHMQPHSLLAKSGPGIAECGFEFLNKREGIGEQKQRKKEMRCIRLIVAIEMVLFMPQICVLPPVMAAEEPAVSR